MSRHTLIARLVFTILTVAVVGILYLVAQLFRDVETAALALAAPNPEPARAPHRTAPPALRVHLYASPSPPPGVSGPGEICTPCFHRLDAVARAEEIVREAANGCASACTCSPPRTATATPTPVSPPSASVARIGGGHNRWRTTGFRNHGTTRTAELVRIDRERVRSSASPHRLTLVKRGDGHLPVSPEASFVVSPWAGLVRDRSEASRQRPGSDRRGLVGSLGVEVVIASEHRQREQLRKQRLTHQRGVQRATHQQPLRDGNRSLQASQTPPRARRRPS